MLRGVCDRVVRGEVDIEARDEGLVGREGGCRCGFGGGSADCEDFCPKPRVELEETNRDCRVLVGVSVVGVGGVTKANFDRFTMASVDIVASL